MEIRSLLPPPWDSLMPLVEASRAEGLRFLLRFKDEYLSGQARFDYTGDALLGAYEGAELIGLCGLTHDPYGAGASVGRVRHLYVRPEWRRRGIGRRLLEEIEHRASETFDSLVLRTDSMTASQFYRAVGFERIAEAGTATHRHEITRTTSR